MAATSAFEAISDPTRRAILDTLANHGPKRAGDIAGQFPQISRPAVSKHLRVLRGAELVRQEPRGREMWYELRPAPLNEVQIWIRDYERFWSDKLQKLKQVVENE